MSQNQVPVCTPNQSSLTRDANDLVQDFDHSFIFSSTGEKTEDLSNSPLNNRTIQVKLLFLACNANGWIAVF